MDTNVAHKKSLNNKKKKPATGVQKNPKLYKPCPKSIKRGDQKSEGREKPTPGEGSSGKKKRTVKLKKLVNAKIQHQYCKWRGSKS